MTGRYELYLFPDIFLLVAFFLVVNTHEIPKVDLGAKREIRHLITHLLVRPRVQGLGKLGI